MKVVGLDLSLTATGVAADGATGWSVRTIASVHKGERRLVVIRDEVLEASHGADLVVIEGYSYGSKYGAHQAGELGGVVRVALFEAAIPFAVVAPLTLKRYATGRGGGGKEAVLVQAVKRTNMEFRSNDEADAFWLYAMGREHLGRPLLAMPAPNRAALAKVPWPDLEAVA